MDFQVMDSLSAGAGGISQASVVMGTDSLRPSCMRVQIHSGFLESAAVGVSIRRYQEEPVESH